jgi:hypothetical protein
MKTARVPLEMQIAINRAAMNRAKQDGWREIRAAGAYNLGKSQEVKPMVTRAEWPWLVATVSFAVVIAGLGIWKLAEIVGGAL